MLVEGAISVKACLQAKKRTIKLVYIDKAKKTKDFNYLRKIIKENKVEYKEVDRYFFTELNCGKTHGGIVAEVGPKGNDCFEESDIFFLDGIEDPFNLGYIMRTLYAFGIKNVLLAKRDYSLMEAQLLKSSAGAYEWLNIGVSEDAIKDLKDLKEKGYTAYALKRGEDAVDIFKESFVTKALFLLGGEKRGISSNLMELCDKYCYIPYGSDFRNSLNAAGAADVVATLLFAQRKHD